MKRALRVIPTLCCIIIAATSFTLLAQNGGSTKPAPVVATPNQQKEFKPLLEAQSKAQAEFDEAVSKLPEVAAFNSAKKALETAMAKMPAKAKLDEAQEQVKDSAFRYMAELKLSSREYTPSIDSSGELIFTKTEKAPKIEPKKPN